MNRQLKYYISIEPVFFQESEGEFGVKITGKWANFLRTFEESDINQTAFTQEFSGC